MADYKELMKQLIAKYPGADNQDIKDFLDPNKNSHGTRGFGDARNLMSPEDSSEFLKLMTRNDISKMDMNNPKHAQHIFNRWKGEQANIRDIQNRLPLSEKFEDQMSDTLIRQKPTGQTAAALESMGLTGDALLDHLKDAGYNMERKRGYMQKMSDGVPFEKLMKMVKPGAKTLLSALPLAATGLAAAGIGSDAMAGEFGKAGMGAADLATDFMPGISQVKDVISSEELGAGEDKLLAELKNQQVQNDPEERRFSKIKALIGR